MDKIDQHTSSPAPVKAPFEIFTSLGWRLILGFCIAASALVLFGWFASEVFEGETRAFDDSVRQAVQGIASPMLTRLMIIISFIGSPGFLTILGVPAAIIFLRLKWKHAFTLLAITITGEIILNLVLKGFFRRTRPEPFFDYAIPSSFSFPSGHALGAFCFYGIMAWLIAARIKDRRLKAGLWTISILLVLSVGFSRIYLGVHYPSDIIAGYLAAFVWTATVALGDAFIHRGKLHP